MRNRRLYMLMACAALLAILATVYYFVDPVEVKWMPRCIWKAITGTDCPGCGSQRMAHALLHGDLRAAWSANAYALCMLPVIGLLIGLEFYREKYSRLYRLAHAPAVIWALTLSVIAWWMVRNLI